MKYEISHHRSFHENLHRAVVLATTLSCFSTPAELEPGRPKVPVASVYVDGKEVLSGQIEYFGRDVDENWRQLRDVEFVATKDFASLGVGKDDNHFFSARCQ